MPRTNPKYSLEISTQPNVDAAYQREVNDKMRTIANALDAGTPSTSTGGGVTVSGSQLILAAPGVLAIQSSVAPLVSLGANVTPTEILAYLKQASQGADLLVNINVNGNLFFTVKIGAGATDYDKQGSFGTIAAGDVISVDIVDCGTTFPGSDLSLILRF